MRIPLKSSWASAALVASSWFGVFDLFGVWPIVTPPLPVAAAEIVKPQVAVEGMIRALDTAANGKKLDAVLQFYAPNFSHGDGLNRTTIAQSLKQLWQQYPTLNYVTRVESVKPSSGSNRLQVDTTTQITGAQTQANGQLWKLKGRLRTRYQVQTTPQGTQILRQDILSEKTELNIGEKAPMVQFNLPETVGIGQNYAFEAILAEPLEKELLMGEVMEVPVQASALLSGGAMRLQLPSITELLSDRDIPDRNRKPKVESSPLKTVKLRRVKAGGFFKIGRAGNLPQNLWLSAIFARHDAGLTIVTQRLRILNKPASRNLARVTQP